MLTGAWHDLGEETRLFSYTAFALYVQDEPVAVATAGTTVSASVEQSAGLDRLNTIELTRICRSPVPAAKGVLRAMLRLWRDFLAVPYWTFRPDVTKRALVTYSLPGKKGGDLYRFDGWVRLRPCRPWHGNGTWQHGSRVGTPEALWVYWLPDGTTSPQQSAESAQGRLMRSKDLIERFSGFREPSAAATALLFLHELSAPAYHGAAAARGALAADPRPAPGGVGRGARPGLPRLRANLARAARRVLRRDAVRERVALRDKRAGSRASNASRGTPTGTAAPGTGARCWHRYQPGDALAQRQAVARSVLHTVERRRDERSDAARPPRSRPSCGSLSRASAGRRCCSPRSRCIAERHGLRGIESDHADRRGSQPTRMPDRPGEPAARGRRPPPVLDVRRRQPRPADRRA